jgi:hypothetical protein
MTSLLHIEDITCDTLGIESDGSRWSGQLVFACDGLSAAGTWIGYDRSEDGQLVDIEGESEAFCARVDDLKDQFERAVSAKLGRPREEDPTGLWSAFEAVAQARTNERAA